MQPSYCWEVEGRNVILRRTPMVSWHSPVEVEFVPIRRKGHSDFMRGQIRRYWNRSRLKPEGATAADVSFVSGKDFEANSCPVHVNRWLLLMWLTDLITAEQFVGWGSVGLFQLPGIKFFYDEIVKLKKPTKEEIVFLSQRAHLFPTPYAVKGGGSWISV